MDPLASMDCRAEKVRRMRFMATYNQVMKGF